jgi:hypothetical protein
MYSPRPVRRKAGLYIAVRRAHPPRVAPLNARAIPPRETRGDADGPVERSEIDARLLRAVATLEDARDDVPVADRERDDLRARGRDGRPVDVGGLDLVALALLVDEHRPVIAQPLGGNLAHLALGVP